VQAIVEISGLTHFQHYVFAALLQLRSSYLTVDNSLPLECLDIDSNDWDDNWMKTPPKYKQLTSSPIISELATRNARNL